jgi:hypothetical protein
MEDFERAAKKLNIQSSGLPSAPPDNVISWLELHYPKRWLIIFDEVDSVAINITRYIPPACQGKFLITSRNRQMIQKFPDGIEIEVPPLDEDSALSLLRNGIIGPRLTSTQQSHPQTRAEEVAQRNVVRQVGYLPLAITLVGAYLNDNPEHSCEWYMKAQSSVKNTRIMGVPPAFTGYPLSVWQSFEMSLQSLRLREDSPTSLMLLYFIAACGDIGSFSELRYLCRHVSNNLEDDDIGALRELQKVSNSNEELFAALKPLFSLSLIQGNGSMRIGSDNELLLYSIHGLIVEWIQYKYLSECGRAFQSILLVLRCMATSILRTEDQPSSIGYKRFLRQILLTCQKSPTLIASAPVSLSEAALPFITQAYQALRGACTQLNAGPDPRDAFETYEEKLREDISNYFSEQGHVDWRDYFSAIINGFPTELRDAIEHDSQDRKYLVMDFIASLDKHECFAATFDRIIPSEWELAMFFPDNIQSIVELREVLPLKVKEKVLRGIDSDTQEKLENYLARRLAASKDHNQEVKKRGGLLISDFQESVIVAINMLCTIHLHSLPLVMNQPFRFMVLIKSLANSCLPILLLSVERLRTPCSNIPEILDSRNRGIVENRR